jgi:hypothetical protein
MKITFDGYRNEFAKDKILESAKENSSRIDLDLFK